MNAVPNQPEHPEADLAAAQDRIQQLEEKLSEAEQELEAASDIINEQQVQIECLRIQLEDACLTIDEGTAARRKLEERIADLEDELVDEPCQVPMPGEKS
jgi:TolA-binding protein